MHHQQHVIRINVPNCFGVFNFSALNFIIATRLIYWFYGLYGGLYGSDQCNVHISSIYRSALKADCLTIKIHVWFRLFAYRSVTCFESQNDWSH